MVADGSILKLKDKQAQSGLILTYRHLKTPELQLGLQSRLTLAQSEKAHCL